MNRGVCRVCGKNLALTSSGRIPRHLAQDKAARTVEAVDLIGHEGVFRLPGGRTTYEAVMYNDARARSDRPRLARLEARQDGLHQVERWVDWEQPIEVIRDFTQEEEDQRQAEIAAYDRSL
jgi:hypothetical protein